MVALQNPEPCLISLPPPRPASAVVASYPSGEVLWGLAAVGDSGGFIEIQFRFRLACRDADSGDPAPPSAGRGSGVSSRAVSLRAISRRETDWYFCTLQRWRRGLGSNPPPPRLHEGVRLVESSSGSPRRSSTLSEMELSSSIEAPGGRGARVRGSPVSIWEALPGLPDALLPTPRGCSS